MIEQPTPAITAKDQQGTEHEFRMDFGARRRIARRLRALQMKGELPEKLERDTLRPLDNVEIAYLTVAECRLDRREDEDAFLGRWDVQVLAQLANDLVNQFSEPPTEEDRARARARLAMQRPTTAPAEDTPSAT